MKDESSDDEGFVINDASLDQIDPTVLSSLPHSVQLDIIAKMREKKVQANREAFEQRQAEPENFSNFQMEEYLKASEMRCHPPSPLHPPLTHNRALSSHTRGLYVEPIDPALKASK